MLTWQSLIGWCKIWVLHLILIELIFRHITNCKKYYVLIIFFKEFQPIASAFDDIDNYLLSD